MLAIAQSRQYEDLSEEVADLRARVNACGRWCIDGQPASSSGKRAAYFREPSTIRATGWSSSTPISARPRPQLREVLERLAERHGISQKDINYAIDGYADDMLSDLVYSVERDLEHESEAAEVCLDRGSTAGLGLQPRTRCKFPKQGDEPLKGPSSPKSQRHAQEWHTVFMIGFDQFVAMAAKAERASLGSA